MSAKFQNKYRSESTRLQYWNYEWDAAYFITICTKGREHYRNIVEGSMQLSCTGVIANILWCEITTTQPNVLLGEFEFRFVTVVIFIVLSIFYKRRKGLPLEVTWKRLLTKRKESAAMRL